MEKRRVAAVADNVFLVIGVWMLSYLWTRYYVMNLLVCLIAATGIALMVVVLINIKRSKNRTARKRQRHIDDVMNQFLFSGVDFSLQFLFCALKDKLTGKDVQKKDGFVVANKTAVFGLFLSGAISLERVIECYVAAKKAGAQRMILLTLFGLDKLARSATDHLPDLKIDVFDKNKSYDFLGWAGSLPEVKIVVRASKPSLKSILLGAFDKGKARNYFVISIVLLASSYFVAYSIYYIVAASVAFCLAIICRLSLVKKSKQG